MIYLSLTSEDRNGLFLQKPFFLPVWQLLPWLSPRLSPRPRLIPTTLEDTMVRGLLSPRPRLIPTTLEDTMVDMVLVMPTTDMALDTMDMDSDTTARGLLRLSPRPRLIPTTLEDTMV